MEDNKIESLLIQIIENQNKMQTDITGMQTDITGMQTDITGMQTDITGMKSDIAGMKSDIAGMKSDIAGMKSDIAGMKSDIAEIKGKIDSVYDQTADLTEFRTETKENFISLNKDVKFIKHKLHKTEEDVFDIKDQLKIVK